MKSIYIIGAGGSAKEIFLLIKEINAVKKRYEFKGFVDVVLEDKKLFIGRTPYPVISEVSFLKKCREDVALTFGIGDPTTIKKVSTGFLKYRNFEFPNLIHPGVALDQSVRMGVGNVISSACVFTVDIVMQSFNYINRGVHVGHDCSIGSYNVLNPCSVISGGVIIKDENLIGSNATILQYLKMDSKNIIGAGAVVTKSVGRNSCLVGVPAKKINKDE